MTAREEHDRLDLHSRLAAAVAAARVTAARVPTIGLATTVSAAVRLAAILAFMAPARADHSHARVRRIRAAGLVLAIGRVERSPNAPRRSGC